MIKVLKQSEMIPKVPLCVGSGTHIRGGSLGVEELVARFSIYFRIGKDNWSGNKVKSVGFYKATREQPLICEGIICTIWEDITMLEVIPDIFQSPAYVCPFPACLLVDLNLMAAIVSGIVKIIKSTQRLSEFHNGKPVISFTTSHTAHFSSAHTSWTRDPVIIAWFDS